MSPLRIALTIIFIVAGIILTIVILKQESKQNGLSGALMGSGAADDSYWAKNKGRSKEGKLITWSRVFIVIFLALGLILNIKAI